ncbi:GNAT family N-acetyltransferase [Costertonia aggregata]|uniref:GNAT family N-acetyltransferase n=1 Tax=Costertonia aggregata TaxID=343403 RepID=A0A7H9AT80_9FLAO|nr:GNAT family N-acetyltransferase [Costertonia aggregata]QLG46683.1 GNAT family N-acetyltransferase [Costertonia aggregata]
MTTAINQKQIEDITFIGSGISTSFTLLHLLEKVKDKKEHPFLNITVIDKYGEFNTGIPYGKRSGFSVLLITSLRNFLPEPELSPFLKWLKLNKEWLIDEFKSEGGELSKKWVVDHATEIKNNEWEDLFIPRRFFGCYIDEKVKTTVDSLEKEKRLKVSYIASEVIDTRFRDDCWEVLYENTTPTITKKLVLSIGSLPTNPLWKNDTLLREENLLFINNPYKLELQRTLETIKTFLKDSKGKVRNAVIVGSNASGLEMLYKMNDDKGISDLIDTFTMLSTQGLLPDSEIDFQKLSNYSPGTLKSLQKKESLTAKEIADAVYKDLDAAERIDLGAASTVGVVSSAFGSLLGKLNKRELGNFACYHGNEIGRRQRVAGLHYSNTVKALKKKNRFQHIAGRFSDMKKNGNTYNLEYLDTASKKKMVTKHPVDIVINCVGGMNLYMDKIPELLKNMLQKGYISANDSKIGITVNNRMEASHNLHIVGPLLAGNVILDQAVWHVEHCGRIIAFSKVLSEHLIQPDIIKDKIALNVYDLTDETDKNHYQNIISEQWNDNPYYMLNYFSHHQKKDVGLIAFELKKNDESVAVMPMVKRKIPNTDFFDVISPYGYSGPIFKYNDDFSIPVKFWDLVDTWYRENDIITEFVRFSLNQNHKSYSGECFPTLDNVNGKLLGNFEDQWERFLPKVRNNYRKSLKYNLKIKFFDKNNIKEKHIRDFYTIYVNTMKRNDAQAFLFFSLDYFNNLVLSNPEKFVLCTVYNKKIPISTELIIVKDSYIHAFLGGTEEEYFHLRPNDFLRVEVIKWAIEMGKKNYILGGGVRNNDGLYKSKKALFPKDNDVMFYTGRKIIDKKKYQELNHKLLGAKVNNTEGEINDFFPIYRQVKVS